MFWFLNRGTLRTVVQGVVNGQEFRCEVSTVDTSDNGWETAVFLKKPTKVRGRASIIVEEYPNEHAALRGHEKWSQHVEAHGPFGLVDVATNPLSTLASWFMFDEPGTDPINN